MIKKIILLIIISCSFSLYSQTLPNEVNKALLKKNDNERLNILLDFGEKYYNHSDFNNSANCYKAAAKIYGENKEGVAYCKNKAGRAYQKAKNYDKAITEFSEAKKLYSSLNKTKNTFIVTFNLGDTYMLKKQYQKAVSNYKDAYNLIKKSTDYYNQAYILNQIAVCYAKWGNNTESLKYFKKAEKKAKAGKVTKLQKSIANNIVTLEENIKNKEKHITEYEKIEKKEQEEYVENLQQDLKITKQQNLLSIQEIEKLSYEMQAKELKLIHIKDQYEKQVMENEIKKGKLKLLEAQNNLKEIEISKKQAKILEQKRRLGIIGTGLVVVLILLFFIISLYRQKRKNVITLKKQKKEIDRTNKMLQEVNQEIKSSILYAEKIQNSILPSRESILKYIPDFFILFKPRDIVSGDFYWFYKKGNDFWGAVVDCTGHGVPGAFMSMIGNSLLNKIILENDTKTPSILLSKLNKELKYALSQHKTGESTDDGMDMTVVKINYENKKMIMALANHNAFVVKKEQIEVISGDIFSIGGLFSDVSDVSFTDHEINITPGTIVYMFTDGFQDQFGGPENKKYTQQRLKNKIFEIHNKPLIEQQKLLEIELERWKANNKQIDDILVVGVKF